MFRFAGLSFADIKIYIFFQEMLPLLLLLLLLLLVPPPPPLVLLMRIPHQHLPLRSVDTI